MSEMLERCARAMVKLSGPDGFGLTHGNYDALLPESQARWLGFAQVAVETLRNHTLIYRDEGHVVHEMRGAPDDIWKTLLDALLSPTEAPTASATGRAADHSGVAGLGAGS